MPLLGFIAACVGLIWLCCKLMVGAVLGWQVIGADVNCRYHQRFDDTTRTQPLTAEEAKACDDHAKESIK